MKGIEKEVDNLGRIVIPMEYRRVTGVDVNSRVLLSWTDDILTISPLDRHCALCGERIKPAREIRLCDECIEKAKQIN